MRTVKPLASKCVDPALPAAGGHPEAVDEHDGVGAVVHEVTSVPWCAERQESMKASRSACSRSRSVSGSAWPLPSYVDERGAVDQRGGPLAADLEGHDLVVVAVDHQGRDVDLRQVGAEVGGRERRDALVGAAVAAGHALQPERVAEALGHVPGAVVAEERAVGEVAVELRAVGGLAGADRVEDLDRQALGVVVGAQHQRRDRRDQHQPRDPGGAVPGRRSARSRRRRSSGRPG